MVVVFLHFLPEQMENPGIQHAEISPIIITPIPNCTEL